MEERSGGTRSRRGREGGQGDQRHCRPEVGSKGTLKECKRGKIGWEGKRKGTIRKTLKRYGIRKEINKVTIPSDDREFPLLMNGDKKKTVPTN